MAAGVGLAGVRPASGLAANWARSQTPRRRFSTGCWIRAPREFEVQEGVRPTFSASYFPPKTESSPHKIEPALALFQGLFKRLLARVEPTARISRASQQSPTTRAPPSSTIDQVSRGKRARREKSARSLNFRLKLIFALRRFPTLSGNRGIVGIFSLQGPGGSPCK